jgi:beta-galactosidase
VFTDALMLPGDDGVQILSVEKNDLNLKVFPQITGIPVLTTGKVMEGTRDKIFSNYQLSLPKFELQPKVTMTGTRKASINLPSKLPDGLNDLFLSVDYWGDTAMGFLGGNLVADEFYKGEPWQIGLKRFIGGHDLNFGMYFRPLMDDAPFLVDLPGNVVEELKKSKQLLKINSIKFIPEYKTTLKF